MADPLSKAAKVARSDLSSIVEIAIRRHMHGFEAKSAIEMYRRLWPEMDDYGRRHALTAIEVEVALDKFDHDWPGSKEAWAAFAEEVRPPKAPFTIDYRCGKCRVEGVKLWRGVHGCKNDEGHELLCARCLAPGEVIDEKGRMYRDANIGGRTDQVRGWLPAVPVGDTYWGYTSAPTSDVRWWTALPTYGETAS